MIDRTLLQLARPARHLDPHLPLLAPQTSPPRPDPSAQTASPPAPQTPPQNAAAPCHCKPSTHSAAQSPSTPPATPPPLIQLRQRHHPLPPFARRQNRLHNRQLRRTARQQHRRPAPLNQRIRHLRKILRRPTLRRPKIRSRHHHHPFRIPHSAFPTHHPIRLRTPRPSPPTPYAYPTPPPPQAGRPTPGSNQSSAPADTSTPPAPSSASPDPPTKSARPPPSPHPPAAGPPPAPRLTDPSARGAANPALSPAAAEPSARHNHRRTPKRIGQHHPRSNLPSAKPPRRPYPPPSPPQKSHPQTPTPTTPAPPAAVHRRNPRPRIQPPHARKKGVAITPSPSQFGITTTIREAAIFGTDAIGDSPHSPHQGESRRIYQPWCAAKGG